MSKRSHWLQNHQRPTSLCHVVNVIACRLHYIKVCRLYCPLATKLLAAYSQMADKQSSYAKLPCSQQWQDSPLSQVRSQYPVPVQSQMKRFQPSLQIPLFLQGLLSHCLPVTLLQDDLIPTPFWASAI